MDIVSGKRRPRAPSGLKAPGRELWRSVVDCYDLSPAEMETLRQACRTVDLIARMDEVLLVQDMIQEGGMGQPKAHPLLTQVADHRRLLGGLFRDLCLPMPNEDTGRRRSPSAAAAANARWRQSG